MDNITLGYGGGGKLTHDLIDSLFIKELSGDVLREKKDSALLEIGNKKIAFTTDSYVVKPIFFPGGDIGSLAVYGTVNDLSVCGAKPLFISIAVIIEEGLERKALEKITRSIGIAARRSGVEVVTGDTKVVERGSCDKVFINTSGIGEVFYAPLSADRIRPGDAVIVSGPVGDHAISVLSKREGMAFGTDIKSDSINLNGLIGKALRASNNVRFMRDPTRGGVATTLNEIVERRPFGIWLYEEALPVRRGVRSACELLGFDPIYLACEGRVIIIASDNDAGKVLSAIRKDPNGAQAEVIGKVTGANKGKVLLETRAGGKRLVDMLSGDQLPRIC